MPIHSIRKTNNFIVLILNLFGWHQTDPAIVCLPDRFVFGGGGEFMGYKNAMDNDCESIYHSTTSFHRGQNRFTNIPPPTQNGSGFVFPFLKRKKSTVFLCTLFLGLCGIAVVHPVFVKISVLIIGYLSVSIDRVFDKSSAFLRISRYLSSVLTEINPFQLSCIFMTFSK